MKTAKMPAAELSARPSDAKLAYFEGDFSRCLELCSKIVIRTTTAASEVGLLRARALLRTGRPREAEEAILESLQTHTTIDASLTAEMLIGSARIRQGDADGGIEILKSAARHSAGSHFAIRSEIALCTALGYWSKRDIDAADSYLALVDIRSDIIHARALELQAWCYTARCDFRRAAELFCETVLRLDRCNARDEVITATAVSTIAIYAAELFDAGLAEFVRVRSTSINWSSGLASQRFTMLLHQASFHEFAGNTSEAFAFALQARELAPTPGLQAFGWAVSSMFASNAQESHTAAAYANQANQLLDGIDARDLAGDERFSMLGVAESLAPIDVRRAEDLFIRYKRLAPAGSMVVLSGDPRLAAEESLIEGLIANARRDHERAISCFRNAFNMFREVGYVRRAATAARALVSLTAEAGPREWLEERLPDISNFITRSLDYKSSHPILLSLQTHASFTSLSPAQKDVALLVCLGKSNKEIASQRLCSNQTIRNMLTEKLYPAFGVSCRAEFISTCLGGTRSAPVKDCALVGLRDWWA
jgi:tetratricopeptide (TPR) repeat protein